LLEEEEVIPKWVVAASRGLFRRLVVESPGEDEGEENTEGQVAVADVTAESLLSSTPPAEGIAASSSENIDWDGVDASEGDGGVCTGDTMRWTPPSDISILYTPSRYDSS
jgi:hypothetical protein